MVHAPHATGAMAATARPPSAPAACAARLSTATLDAQLRCLDALKRAGRGTDVSSAIPHLTAVLSRADGTTDERVIVGVLDVLRALGPKGAPAAETISGLLPHRAELYRDRDKMLVVRLRAYMFVTLGEIGVPVSARPALFDVLAHLDERVSPLEIAAAARAAGSLGARARDLAPYLIDAIPLQVSENEFSLERYEPAFPATEATTVQIEVVKSLGRVCSRDDVDAVAFLQRLAADRGMMPFDPRVVRESRQALARIGSPQQGSSPQEAFSTAWVPSSHRTRLKNVDVALTDSTGTRRLLGDLLDQPTLVTFFYTRCQNSGKCSAAVTRLASLQRTLAAAGLDDRVRLLAITYEPQVDTPARLGQFASDRGLQLGERSFAIQLDRERHHAVVDELQAPVNYNTDWVNTHGVELTLIDGRGRVVRKYTTVLWSNDQVTDDLRRLLDER